ncbi:MAG: mevalonate kinase [Candidatus Bathyarchaeota archaeon]|nr:MAG: mevalonate kinase [Candidatus Bathyarchaeota archaeon]
MGRGFGFGKVILFGEHFVVHGVPGIVSAIDSTADAEVRNIGEGINVSDDREGAKGYARQKRTQQRESIRRMLKTMRIDPHKTSLKILLGGSLPGFSGIGASAASSVAIARAIADEFEMRLSDEEINEIAFEAEKAYAGTPSGIDNTAATYGGLIWFKRNLSGGPNTIEKLSIKEPVEAIVGNTGIVADTKAMVAGVAERKKSNPRKYNQLFKHAEDLAFTARKALERFDLRTVGQLMNENHHLLQEIGVSCKELDYLVNFARKQGALGAKLTGGGGGGCMIALVPGKELQKATATALEKEGFKVLRTKIGIQNIKKI